MDPRDDIREFLTSRRAKITPEQAKLPAYGGNRRVAGLRREEVAMLAGVSVDYYTKLERGNFGSVSEGVLEALVRALQLDAPEREHLFHLANATATIKPGGHREASPHVRQAVQRVVDGLADAPAFVRNNRRDLLASNALGRALYSPIYEDVPPGQPVNTVCFLFFNPKARVFFRDWNKAAADVVANLRTEVGRDPHDRLLQELIGELLAGSAEFSAHWASHDVRYHDTGFKTVHHPEVGDLDLTFETMDLPADPGQALIVYGAEPASATEASLRLLASWAATTAAEARADAK
ncbi:transcriptional regulator with XRE-family HTH domain [Conyzicola lurida]|uniref:Transcriptional regulator with XRE-family HTH domain n=1 Tax=Conyzicola lurida TaxID=1172621 RepID=A0A841AL38_9MICO|nr:helix-turn-helix transcriptional regulator [Conyzicola lurida]MBB5844670.1 transcriptional regulator with XRE-family HTH domain [Conyzicola lurida]